MLPLSIGGLGSTQRVALALFIAVAALTAVSGQLLAHNVTAGDAGYFEEIWGVHLVPFAYLGAKHMVTGYDHILFLLGVVFSGRGVRLTPCWPPQDSRIADEGRRHRGSSVSPQGRPP